LPDNSEILLPESHEGYYATRGAIAGLQRLSKDPRFTPGTEGVVKYEDKDGSIKEYHGTSFIKKPRQVVQENQDLPGFNVESWSKKEGWSVDYFNRKVRPRLHEAW
jgi:hypothetical protein